MNLTPQNQLPPIEHDELAAWLRLLCTPGVGRAKARVLLSAFGSPQAVFDAPPSAWRDVVPASVAQALGSEPDGLRATLDTTWRWLHPEGQAPSPPRSVVVLGSDAYPNPWLQIADPPLLVYLQGQVGLLAQPSLALVGSRGATPQGLINARAFAQALSLLGLTVVSGLACGIDGAAHEGGLMGPGSTIAVVGTGLDRVYPRQHRDLAHQIAQKGLIVSEYAPGTPALAAHFPQRNRLIAGLSLGTLVVEAALPSGSLITARLAMEAGREVFAIPGSIHAPQARGCHALIKQGAKLVECAQDILDELNWQAPLSASSALPRPHDSRAPASAEAAPLLAALGHDTLSLEALAERTGWPPQTLNVQLLQLELSGRVARLPGQMFQQLQQA